MTGDVPAELIHGNRRAPSGLTVHTDDLEGNEQIVVGETRVTSPTRTAFDIGRRTTGRTQAISDSTHSLVPSGRQPPTSTPSLRHTRECETCCDCGGCWHSWMAELNHLAETDARLALIDAGLPTPGTQLVIRGRYEEFIARVDLAYEDVKVAIEYDGPQHWTDPRIRQGDIDKGVELNDLDWGVVRVSRDLLHHRRATYLHRVTTILHERGMA